MMKKFCFLLLGVGMSFSLSAQERVTGQVFEDLNGNGKKERRERGIAEVAVSNGVEVVLTDAEGRYSLPIQAGQTVFVVKPADFSLPVNENNLPQFYYIHKPEGSPKGLTYPGSAPTGALPKSVDFPLLPGAKKTDFTALVFGDPQPYSLEELEYFNRGVVQEVMQIPNLKEMPFGVSLGDIVGDKLDLFPYYAKTIGQVGLPWFSVMGNHDMNFDVEKDAFSDETFTATFGPATYAFNEGDAHFIVLENILYPDPRDGKGYWGGMREDQLTWLENNLALVPKDRLVVVFMHIPIFEENGDSFRDADRETLLRLLSPFENSVSFSAHTHYMKQTYWGRGDGFAQDKAHHHFNVGTPSGDWYKGTMTEAGLPDATMRDGSPNGYLFLQVSGTEYKTRYKAAGKPAEYQMELFAPKVIEAGKRSSAQLIANFFVGAADNSLRYRINGGKWQAMRQVESVDPTYFLKTFAWDVADEVLSGRRPSNPVLTDHLWTANVPTDLPAGTHTFEVEATDSYGQKHRATRTFRVVAAPEAMQR